MSFSFLQYFNDFTVTYKVKFKLTVWHTESSLGICLLALAVPHPPHHNPAILNYLQLPIVLRLSEADVPVPVQCPLLGLQLANTYLSYRFEVGNYLT